MTNHRSNCPFCKNPVLSRDIGFHILKNHKDNLFVGDNLKSLHRDKYLTKPLELCLGEDTFYFCLADNSCIKKSVMADKHFKGKSDAHRDTLLKLRETYPLGNQTVEADQTPRKPSGPLLEQKEKEALQELVMMIFAQGEIGFTRKVKSAFGKLGIVTEEEDLKDLYPHHDAFQEKVEEEVVEEEEAVVEEPVVEEPPYEPPVVVPPPPAPVIAPVQETPVLPPPQPVIKNQLCLPGATVEQTAKFLEMFPPDSKDFQKLFTSVTTNKYQGVPPEVAALMYKSSSLQREPAPSFGNLIQNTKTIQKAQRVQKPPL